MPRQGQGCAPDLIRNNAKLPPSYTYKSHFAQTWRVRSSLMYRGGYVSLASLSKYHPQDASEQPSDTAGVL